MKSSRRAKKTDRARSSILVHAEKCTGCGQCEIACRAQRAGAGEPHFSALRITDGEPDFSCHVPLLCCECAEAPCIAVCPGEALSRKGPFGPVSVEQSRCSACASCVLSCPFEVLHLSGRRSLPDPCDLCRGNPACVRACPTGALELIELNGKSLRRKRALSRKLLSMREKLNGGEALTSSGPLS